MGCLWSSYIYIYIFKIYLKTLYKTFKCLLYFDVFFLMLVSRQSNAIHSNITTYRKHMVIGISSNGGIKTIDGRWLLQKEPMRKDHDRGSQTTPFLRTSFSYDHIIICHLHCCHVTVRIETIIMYKGSIISLGGHHHPSLLVSNDDRHNNSGCCGGTVIHSRGLYDPPTDRMCASTTLLQFLVARRW
jgi:hypothetical protein